MPSVLLASLQVSMTTFWRWRAMPYLFLNDLKPLRALLSTLLTDVGRTFDAHNLDNKLLVDDAPQNDLYK